MEISNMFPLARRITELREQNGYTINSLSYLTGISQSYLRDLESGVKNNPSVEIIYIICERLGISLKDFFDIDIPAVQKENPLILRINQLEGPQREALLAFLDTVK